MLKWMHRLLTKRIRSSLLSGLVAAFAVLFGGGLLISLLLHAFNLPGWLYTGLLYGCHLLAIFTGAVHVTLRRKRRGLFNGIRIGLFYAIIIWMIGIFGADHSFTWVTTMLGVAAVVIGGCSGLWAVKQIRSA
jgi:putative membrane protein (TIGR04086 family)